MAKIDLYTIKGVKSGDLTLPKSFDEEINMNTLAQALRIYEERAHPGLRNTKTRSEVNRTTKKVYKQKGTGGARHGSRRANLFVGGGVVFGPRPDRRMLNISDKLKIKASGGIRDFDTAMRMINAGANRIGTSQSLSIIKGAK